MGKYFDKKEKIFYWVKSHPNLHYMIHVVRRFGNKRFYRLLFDEGYPGILTIDSYGNENKEKEIFLLDIKGNRIGLPCFIRYTVLALYEIEKLNFKPVIKFTDTAGWLQETGEVNGTNNIFEYYYSQPDSVSFEQVYKSYHVFSCNITSLLNRANKDLGFYEENGLLASYQVSEEYLEIMGSIYKKYLYLNEQAETCMKEGIKQLFGNHDCDKVIGVHVRGTDFAAGFVNHPKIITMKQFENAIQEGLKKGFFTKIFLATDDTSKLDYLRKKFPERILYYDNVLRSAGKKNILSMDGNKEYSKYRKGLEVLRDVYTLASCGGLVAGLSHVSILARIVKYSFDKKYSYQNILSNGINRQGGGSTPMQSRKRIRQ